MHRINIETVRRGQRRNPQQHHLDLNLNKGVYMKQLPKDIWQEKCYFLLNGDGRYKTPHRKDKKLVRKIKRNMYKQMMKKELEN